ncbi:MAG TPA: sugar kinase [Puia sp.]|nr:sugar kinase [Puia sp.]
MSKVLSFGEILLRMSPSADGEWIKKNTIPVYIGGAELNVAAALANWKMPVAYFSAMPENYLSSEILKNLKERNIDTSLIHFSGNRIGIYILQQGKDLKNSGVIYDRNYSSFSELKPGMIDWDKVLKDVSWFHFSAISPALNSNIAALCKEVLEVASKKRITISVDLNHRPKLWQYGNKPVDVMPDLVQHCDVVMGNIWSANVLLGVDVDEHIHHKGKKEDYLEHARATSLAIKKKFPKCETIANTFRFDYEQQGILYYASLFHDNHQYHSKEFVAEKIVDKVGTGDCFMAGLIYGLYQKNNLQDTILFAAAAAFGKFFETGDFTNQDIDAVQSILYKS